MIIKYCFAEQIGLFRMASCIWSYFIEYCMISEHFVIGSPPQKNIYFAIVIEIAPFLKQAVSVLPQSAW